jgi:predicted CoA-substrate-specific enzyme activase
LIVGIDIGSRKVKMVWGDEKITKKSCDTVRFYQQYVVKKNSQIELDLPSLGFCKEAKIIATGYGSGYLKLEGAQKISEIYAHVLGAVHLTGLKDFILLDIGGQDTKVVRVSGGRVVDFLTNDRCAASSGRFLENMAAFLDVSLEFLQSQYENPVSLSSTCAIFSETELVGKISEGYGIKELCAGVNYSLFKRIEPLVLKFPEDKVFFSGGVGKNLALKHFIEDELKREVIVPDEPAFVGALGCFFYGKEKA